MTGENLMEEQSNQQQPADANQSASSDEIKEKIIAVLRTVYDPEIPVDIYELGLVYDIDVKPSGAVDLKMTLTSPMCPVAESLPPEVESKIGKVSGVTEASVEVVWDPPWTMEMMSEAAKLQLGML